VNDDIESARLDYERGTLDEASVARDPYAQFGLWLAEALATESIVEANAMTLATVGAAGRPAARIVLLRGYDDRGFRFFTNYRSRKGRELEAFPNAALVFYWAPLQRQVRIEGDVSRVTPAESDAYFATRPRGHRLGAWASPQSEVVVTRAPLDEELRRYEERFAGRDVERPEYWGGYRVAPIRFEFWQGRTNRIHDRIAYEPVTDAWRILRLAP
jgi:pyridoxamine 5'-phosphate oxidase